MLVIGIVLPFTGIFVPSRVPFFITRAHAHEASVQQQDDEQKGDTAKRKKPRYSVRRTTTETTEDVKHRSSDLQDPDNLKTEVTYDEKDGTYQVGTVLVGKDEKGKDKQTKKKYYAKYPLSYKRKKLHGFQALYFRYVYLLRGSKTKAHKKYLSYDIRKEVIRLERYQKQFLFLLKMDIKTEPKYMLLTYVNGQRMYLLKNGNLAPIEAYYSKDFKLYRNKRNAINVARKKTKESGFLRQYCVVRAYSI